MRASVVRGVFLTLGVVAVLGGSMLVFSGCNGDNDYDADDWVVIHANRLPNDDGNPITDCGLVAGLEIASLPGCMYIEQGDKIGFVNYYNETKVVNEENVNVGKAVVVKFTSSAFGTDEITLQYQERKVLEVQQTPGSFFQITLEFLDGTGDLGGPVMVPVKPDSDD